MEGFACLKEELDSRNALHISEVWVNLPRIYMFSLLFRAVRMPSLCSVREIIIFHTAYSYF